ncbi:hypothetical protein Dip518_001422 [Parelusimicrobium proximum]|uniref:hypothetical protein n=1 Tax=Parelusimicrobium proximum TaxID=3228953 RepID=UPI003D16D882
MTFLKDLFGSVFWFPRYKSIAQRHPVYVLFFLIFICVVSFAASFTLSCRKAVKEAYTAKLTDANAERGFSFIRHNPEYKGEPAPGYFTENDLYAMSTDNGVYYILDGEVYYRAFKEGESFFTLAYSEDEDAYMKALFLRAAALSAGYIIGLFGGMFFYVLAGLFIIGILANRDTPPWFKLKAAVFMLVPVVLWEIAAGILLSEDFIFSHGFLIRILLILIYGLGALLQFGKKTDKNPLGIFFRCIINPKNIKELSYYPALSVINCFVFFALCIFICVFISRLFFIQPKTIKGILSYADSVEVKDGNLILNDGVYFKTADGKGRFVIYEPARTLIPSLAAMKEEKIFAIISPKFIFYTINGKTLYRIKLNKHGHEIARKHPSDLTSQEYFYLGIKTAVFLRSLLPALTAFFAMFYAALGPLFAVFICSALMKRDTPDHFIIKAGLTLTAALTAQMFFLFLCAMLILGGESGAYKTALTAVRWIFFALLIYYPYSVLKMFERKAKPSGII